MIKTASKLLYALAGFGLATAVLFSAFSGGHKLGMDSLLGPLTLGWKGYVGNHVAYAVLAGLSLVSLSLGVLCSLLQEGDAEIGARTAGLAAVPDAAVPVSVNYWPIVGAFSFGLLALGLAVGPIIFVMGILGVSITFIEWTVRAWADRATGDPALNRALRRQLLLPFELPGAGLLVLAAIILGMSRIMLALPSIGSIIVFSAVPAIVLALGSLLVVKPKISPSAIAGLLVVGALALLAGGVAAAIAGERSHGGSHETHETQHEGSVPRLDPALIIIKAGS